MRQDWVWPAAGPRYAVLVIWLCGGASCKREEGCLPPPPVTNSTNTEAEDWLCEQDGRAFGLVLFGFLAYMEGKRFIQPGSLVSTLTAADQPGGISGVVRMEDKYHNREGTCTARRLLGPPQLPPGIIDSSQKGQCATLRTPRPHLKCANPPQLQAANVASEAERRLRRLRFSSPLSFCPAVMLPLTCTL